MISDCYPEIKTRDSLILINIGDFGGQEQILSAEKMHHFASFVVCIVLVVIVQGTNPNESGQHQGTVESVRGLLENVLKRLERLEKKVKEHSTLLDDCCDKTKGKTVFDHLYLFFTALPQVENNSLRLSCR